MDKLFSFIKTLPKVELHAHLSGCIRRSTYKEFLPESNKSQQELSNTITLDEGFAIFSQIQTIQMDQQRLRRIVKEVLQDFCEDNVIYLELRTTPKACIHYNKQEYIQIILEEFREFESQNNMICRLLLSLDRSQGLQPAEETLKLMEKFHHNPYIVGLDISGYPKSQLQIKDYENILSQFKKMGYKISVHLGEVDSPQNLEEIDYMIESGIHRIGHLCYYTQAQAVKIQQLAIPIEICFSSNIATLQMKDQSLHHFQNLQNLNLTLFPCTDDTLLFDTTLSNEICMLSTTFNLNQLDVVNLQMNAINSIFDQTEKINLQEKLNNFVIINEKK